MRSNKQLFYVIQLLLLFVIYSVTGVLGLKFEAISGYATAVWPPTGISLAALLIFGLRLWPAVSLGAFVVNLSTGAPIMAAMGVSLGNTLEAILAVILLNKIVKFRNSLDRVKDVLGFVFIGAILSTLVSASIGTLSIWMFGTLVNATYFSIWRVWWFGDFLSAIIFAPLFLALSVKSKIKLNSTKKVIEGVLLVIMIILVCSVIFLNPEVLGLDNFALAYITFPLLIWAAISFEQLGVVVTSFIISVITIMGAVKHGGPFDGNQLNENIFLMESYRCIFAFTGLILAAIVSERDRVKESLFHAYDDLEKRVAERTLELQNTTEQLKNEIIVRKKVEEERAHLIDQLQLAVKNRDEFFSIASHELKTPITILMLQLQLAQKAVKQRNIEAEDRSYFENVFGLSVRQIQRITKLINDMLDITQIVSGNLKMEFEEVDLSKIVSEAIDQFSEELKLKAIPITFEIEPNLIGLFDRFRIEQVVTNLISNAIKYGNGKPISVHVHRLNESRVVIKVQDQGIGIAQEDLKRIFGRFERVVTMNKISGFGLGLFIVKQILEAHEGSIHVESKLGEGSTFTLELQLES